MPQPLIDPVEIFAALTADYEFFQHEILWPFINQQLCRSAHYYGKLKKIAADRPPKGEGIPPENPIEDIQAKLNLDIMQIRNGEVKISFEQFSDICKVFNVTVVSALKFSVALKESLRQNFSREESAGGHLAELLKEAEREVDYKAFKEATKK